MNRATIEINNKKYTLTTTEQEWYMQDLASEINKNFKNLAQSANKTSDYDAMVLLLINYVDKARKQSDSATNLRNQLQAYMDEASATRAELARVKRELDTLKSQQPTK